MKSLRSISAIVLCSLALSATADDYPNKAIRFIMPYPIGGSIDIAGRMVAQRLADNLGQADGESSSLGGRGAGFARRRRRLASRQGGSPLTGREEALVKLLDLLGL